MSEQKPPREFWIDLDDEDSRPWDHNLFPKLAHDEDLQRYYKEPRALIRVIEKQAYDDLLKESTEALLELAEKKKTCEALCEVIRLQKKAMIDLLESQVFQEARFYSYKEAAAEIHEAIAATDKRLAELAEGK